MASDIIIELKNVSKRYQQQSETITALKKIDLKIKSGDSVCIIGPSGSGKSTLLQLIGGLDTTSDGEVLIHNKNLQKMSDKDLSKFRNHTIGFIFQFFNLMDYMTAAQNVALPIVVSGKDNANARNIAHEMLKKVNLDHRANQYPKQLSGGEMQRVAIARALSNQPKIILADEPTGNLDKNNAEIVMSTLASLAKDGTTVVLVTHDPRAIKYFHTIVEMENGSIKKLTNHSK